MGRESDIGGDKFLSSTDFPRNFRGTALRRNLVGIPKKSFEALPGYGGKSAVCDDWGSPKLQIAIAAIFDRKGEIAVKFRSKSAIIAWDSQN